MLTAIWSAAISPLAFSISLSQAGLNCLRANSLLFSLLSDLHSAPQADLFLSILSNEDEKHHKYLVFAIHY